MATATATCVFYLIHTSVCVCVCVCVYVGQVLETTLMITMTMMIISNIDTEIQFSSVYCPDIRPPSGTPGPREDVPPAQTNPSILGQSHFTTSNYMCMPILRCFRVCPAKLNLVTLITHSTCERISALHCRHQYIKCVLY